MTGARRPEKPRVSDAEYTDLGLEMRACGAEAITLLVQLVHGGGEPTLPPWARQPAQSIVARYHKATSKLGREIDAQAKDHRR